MIQSHEDWLLPLLEPSAAAMRSKRREGTETLHGFSPTTLCPGIQGKLAVFCNTIMLWMRVQERRMAPPAALTLPNPFLMWD